MKLDLPREEEASVYNGQVFYTYKIISSEDEPVTDIQKMMYR